MKILPLGAKICEQFFRGEGRGGYRNSRNILFKNGKTHLLIPESRKFPGRTAEPEIQRSSTRMSSFLFYRHLRAFRHCLYFYLNFRFFSSGENSHPLARAFLFENSGAVIAKIFTFFHPGSSCSLLLRIVSYTYSNGRTGSG